MHIFVCRLDNICFKDDGSVMLIDLDRWEVANYTFHNIYTQSCMYTVGNYTCKQVDFIQLGYLVLYLLVGKDIIKPTAIVLVYYIGKENIDEMSYHSMDIDTLKYVTDSECRTIIQQLLKGIKQ